MSLSPGSALGAYEILEPLGSGGMGQVYRARDTKLGREVAVKILPDDVISDRDRLERFRREAQLLASLNHPNVAAIYGFEEAQGRPFLVLELVEGEDLAERLKRGALPTEEALEIARQIAEGLEEAHRRGIIHRDLKPANVKLTPEGNVKVLDFGLAKAYLGDAEASPSELSQSPTLTRQGTMAGAILGTAAYMSPEQAKGKRLDKRTDIWSFGALLFELLTARKAFAGEDVSETLAAILKQDPDWTQLPAEAPPPIRDLLDRCLRRDVKRRLQDIGDARIQIEEAKDASGSVDPATAANGGLSRLVVTAAGASALTAIVVLNLVPASSPRAPAEVTRTIIPLPEDATLLRRFTPAVALSTDGRRVAFVAGKNEASRLYVRALDELEARPVRGADSARMPFFSPDGRWVGFYDPTAGALMKVSLGGGAPVAITEMDTGVRGAAWGDDGHIIFAASTGGLSRISAEGGEPEILTTPDRDRRIRTHRFPHVLPGGRAILFTMGSADIDSFDEAAIAVLELDTGEHRVLLEGGSNPHYVASGHLVYARAGALLAVPFDLPSLSVTGLPVTVLENVTMDPIAGNAELDLSGRGHLLYAPGGSFVRTNRLVWADRMGQTEILTEQPFAYSFARLSPNGEELAAFIASANNAIWIYQIARGTLTPLVTGYDNHIAAWSPDGRYVGFSSNRDGPMNLYRQVADGSAPVEALVEGPFYQSGLCWSPDGTWLAFDELRPDTARDIWVLSLDGARTPEAFARTKANEENPQFSPDGRFLAYVSDETGRREIYLQTFPSSGRKWRISTEGGSWSAWNPQGGELFFANDERVFAVRIETGDVPRIGNPRVLFDVPPSHVGPFDVGLDGERFLLVDRSESLPAPRELVLVQNWVEELGRLVSTP